jgi:enamine deaminase RidA (YjgF/YER057c/UK114 family)
MEDVVSLRCFPVEKSAYEGYVEIKNMLCEDKSPASTTVIISALLISALLMEVEAVAVLGKLK